MSFALSTFGLYFNATCFVWLDVAHQPRAEPVGCMGGLCARVFLEGRSRCAVMILARDLSASFASAALEKTAATSGSSVTTKPPFRYREAYLFGRARLKSYSGRISSTPTSALPPDFIAFFIRSPFATSRLSRTDQADRVAPVREHDRQKPLPLGVAEEDVS